MELLVSMCVIAIILAVTAPTITKMLVSKSGVDPNVTGCINKYKSSTPAWYNAVDGSTKALTDASFTNDRQCLAAVMDTQYDRGKAYNTAVSFAEHGTTTQPTVAKEILRAACDQGGTKACDYFINTCWKSGQANSPYCDDTSGFTDITYYLKLPRTTSNIGAINIVPEMQGYVNQGISNIFKETMEDCVNTPGSFACNIVSPYIIQECNGGNSYYCAIGYDHNLNRSCNQVYSAWSEAPTSAYKLTYKGSPDLVTNLPAPVSVNCNMTSLASAAISGCDSSTPVPDDCNYGYTKSYNKSCTGILSAWSTVPQVGNHKLTYKGTPYTGITVTNAPASVNCNMTSLASAAITGCNAVWNALDNDCAIANANGYNLSCDTIASSWDTYVQGATYNFTNSSVPPATALSSMCPVSVDPPADPTTCGDPETTTIYVPAEAKTIKISNCNMADNPVVYGESSAMTNYTRCWNGNASTSCTGTGCGHLLPAAGGANSDKYICTYPAAVNACNALNNGVNYGPSCSTANGCDATTKGWRLPNNPELDTLKDLSNSNKLTSEAMALNLCDYSSSSSPRCNSYSGCSGANNGNCCPNDIWASASINYYLNGGIWNGPNSTNASYAFSVRCVRSL